MTDIELKNKQVAVIGGGVTGLAAAYHLVNNGVDVTIYERGGTLGGQVRTIEVGGNQVEIFYHHLFRSDTVVIELIKKLGHHDDLAWLPSVGAMHSETKIYPFVGALDLLRFNKVSIFSRLRLGLAALWLRYDSNWQKYEGKRASSWIKKWIGDSGYRAVWRPVLRSKFGAHFEDISMAWFWGKIYLRFASRDGILAKEKLGYLRGSFRKYIDSLAEAIQKASGTVITETAVDEILTTDNQVTGLRHSRHGISNHATCDAMLVTTPTNIFQDIAPPAVLDSPYGELLDTVQYQWASVLLLVLDRPLSDIYWLTMTDEDMPFVVTVEHTNFISSNEYDGNHIVYFSNYADPDDALMQLSVEEVLDIYMPYIKRINPEFDEEWIRSKWFFTDRAGQPVVDYLFHERIPPHRTPVEGLYLANNTQIYPEDRGQNYSIRMGFRAADLILADLADPAS